MTSSKKWVIDLQAQLYDHADRIASLLPLQPTARSSWSTLHRGRASGSCAPSSARRKARFLLPGAVMPDWVRTFRRGFRLKAPTIAPPEF